MRADLEIIQEWIPAGSRVLDLGCGDGELLTWLRDNKNVTGYGLENDADNIAECVAKASTSSSRIWTKAWAILPATVSTSSS